MGQGQSHTGAAAPPSPSRLLDPRSPTTAFARTPIHGLLASQRLRYGVRVAGGQQVTTAAGPVGFDPRSPMAQRTPFAAEERTIAINLADVRSVAARLSFETMAEEAFTNVVKTEPSTPLASHTLVVYADGEGANEHSGQIDTATYKPTEAAAAPLTMTPGEPNMLAITKSSPRRISTPHKRAQKHLQESNSTPPRKALGALTNSPQVIRPSGLTSNRKFTTITMVTKASPAPVTQYHVSSFIDTDMF